MCQQAKSFIGLVEAITLAVFRVQPFDVGSVCYTLVGLQGIIAVKNVELVRNRVKKCPFIFIIIEPYIVSTQVLESDMKVILDLLS